MKNRFSKVIAIILCLSVLFTGSAFSAGAADTAAAEEALAGVGDFFTKGFYNTLNVVVETLVKAICTIYPNPPSWADISEYSREEIGFLEGRDTYATEAKKGNVWSLGYASRSVVPADIDCGKYNLGRDLNNKYAEGVYDDMRIRVVAVDDGSGEGLLVLGAIDALGVTSTDARAIRQAVLAHYADTDVKIASVNIMATH